MSNFTTEEKVSLLFKKSVGKPSTNTSIPFFSEPPIDARPKVFTSQIFAEAIPVPKPLTGWDTNTSTLPGNLTAGQTSTHNNGILKFYYKWPLEKVTNGNNMSYKAVNDNGNNPLQGSVPFNLDPSGGYGLALFRKSGGGVGAQIYDGTGEWVVDPDAGVLTFYQHETVNSYVSSSNPPYLSFYRYIGAIGLPTAGLWTTVTHGITYNDPSNTVLIGRSESESNGTYDLEVNGDTKIHGQVIADEITCMSDRRLKYNVQSVNDPLAKLQKIRGVSFSWKKSGQLSYGVIADELINVLPESATPGPKGYLHVNYNAVIALLIETVKEQAKTIEQIQSELRKKLTTKDYT